jgi:hypothetical protein
MISPGDQRLGWVGRLALSVLLPRPKALSGLIATSVGASIAVSDAMDVAGVTDTALLPTRVGVRIRAPRTTTP